MARITPLSETTAPDAAQGFLTAIKEKFGKVPNFFATIAHAPDVATAFAAFNGALGKTRLTAAEREAIALSQAGFHGCPYCAAAHTAIAKAAGVTETETQTHLAGCASDAKTQALIDFTQAIISKRGQVADTDIAAVKAAGYDDGHIIEAIAVISANTFTNFVNIVAMTDVDFPAVAIPTRKAV